MPSVRVLVDCSELNPVNSGGVRSYTLNVTKALAQNSQILVSILINEESQALFEEIAQLIPADSLYVVKKSSFPWRAILAILERFGLPRIHFYLKSMRVRSIIIQSAADIVYTPTTFLNYNYGKIPCVVTIHDIQEKDLPRNFSRRIRKYRDFRIRNTLKHSSSIHVSSSFVEGTISKNYSDQYQPEKFCVIPEGVEISRFRDYGVAKKRQIIFPARFWPHKNHVTLFKAIERISLEDRPVIVVTGAAQDNFKRVLPIPPGEIVFKGVVSEEELTELYKESFGVLSCSLYESSSLPILEGVAAGCIGIASSIPAHLEMAQQLELRLFAPTNSEELAQLILEVTRDFDENSLNSRSNAQKISKYDWANVGNNLVKEFLKRLGVE